MANVNDFFNFVNFISNKVQVGNSVSPSQFNVVAHRAQMLVFEKDYDAYSKTGETSTFLSYFQKNLTTTVPVTGILTYPSDYQHTASIRSYYVNTNISPLTTGREIKVDEINTSEYGEISGSNLRQPTLRFPKFAAFSDMIKFLPQNIGIVMFDYFRTPIAPVWGYVSTSGRPVYDPSTSTDFEWDDFAVAEVAAMYLSLIGVNLKDNELASFSQMWKQETNTIS